MRHTIEIRCANVEEADFLYNVNHCDAVLVSERQPTHHRTFYTQYTE